MTSTLTPNNFDICEGSENMPICFVNEDMKEKLTEFNYVCCNIPGPGTDTEPFEETIAGCDCEGETCDLSRDSSCNCVQRAWSSARSGTNDSVECLPFPKMSATECNTSCQCSSKCGNRTVQHGIQYKLEVYEDPVKGFCLRTLDPIRKHSYVCEYAGEILTVAEAAKRFSLQTKQDMNYIFALKEHFASGLQITYVDPRHYGNIGRFLNHSCEPNLFMTPVRIDNFVPKLCFFTKRDINVGEELTYHYGGDDSNSIRDSSDLVENLIPCHCKSRACIGYLPFDVAALNHAPDKSSIESQNGLSAVTT